MSFKNKTLIRNFLVLTLIPLTALVGCSRSDGPRKGFNSSFLKLGKVGTISHENNIQPDSSVIVLNDQQNIEFVDDKGLIKVTNFNRNLDQGTLLVGNGKDKAILEVVSEENVIGNDVEVQTRLAKISQLGAPDKDSSFKFEVTPKIDIDNSQKNDQDKDLTEIITVSPDGLVTIKNLTFFDFDLEQSNTLSGTKKLSVSEGQNGKFSAVVKNGSIKLVPTFRGNSEFSYGVPKKVSSRIDALLEYELEVEYNFSAAANFKVEYDLLPIKTMTVTVPGAVPIYLDIELKMPAGVKFESKGAGSITVAYKGKYSFASKLEMEGSDDLKSDVRQDFFVEQTNLSPYKESADFSAELFLEPKVSTRLYKVLGPYAYLHPYIRGEIKFPIAKNQDEFFMGITGGVGLQVSEPVFNSTLLQLDSGSLFNVYQSWDLIQPNDQNSVDINSEVQKSLINDSAHFNISSLTPEGFVVISLAKANDTRNLNFKLESKTKNGLLVKAPHFESTGQLYYFPLGSNSSQKEDQFNYRTHNGKHFSPIQTVKLTVEDSIITENQKPRFALTNNSVNMSFTGPETNAHKVPHYYVGGATFSGIRHQENYDGLFADLLRQIGSPRQVFAPEPLKVPFVKNGSCDVHIALRNTNVFQVVGLNFMSTTPVYTSCQGDLSPDEVRSLKLKPLKLKAAGHALTGHEIRQVTQVDTEYNLETGLNNSQVHQLIEEEIGKLLEHFSQNYGLDAQSVAIRLLPDNTDPKDRPLFFMPLSQNHFREIRIFNRKALRAIEGHSMESNEESSPEESLDPYFETRLDEEQESYWSPKENVLRLEFGSFTEASGEITFGLKGEVERQQDVDEYPSEYRE